MRQTYNRSYLYRDNVNNAVYLDDFIGIGSGDNGFQGYPSGPTGIVGSYIFHDNTTSFVNSGSGEVGFEFVHVSGETGPINIGTIGLSGFYDCRNLVPETSLAYDLGNSEKRWRSMYVGPGTIDFLGNTGETTATIGVNPLGFVYTPKGFTTPTANLGAKSQSNSLIFSGGWAFTSDDDNNSIIYELNELGEGITGTQTFLNYENTSIDNYNGTIIIPNEVSAFNLNGTSTSVNIEIPTIRNQPLVLTNSCDTNATIIHNGTMYYNNIQQSGNVNISNKSVIIHWVPNWENNTSEIFIVDQSGSTGPTGQQGIRGATGSTLPISSDIGNTGNFLFNESSVVYSNNILSWDGTLVKSTKNILCDQTTIPVSVLQNLPAILNTSPTQIVFNYPPSLFEPPYNLLANVYTNKIRFNNSTEFITAGVDYYCQCTNAQTIIIRADTNPSSPIINPTGIESVISVKTNDIITSKTEVSGGIVTLTDNTSIMKISPGANYWFFSNTYSIAMTKTSSTPIIFSTIYGGTDFSITNGTGTFTPLQYGIYDISVTFSASGMGAPPTYLTLMLYQNNVLIPNYTITLQGGINIGSSHTISGTTRYIAPLSPGINYQLYYQVSNYSGANGTYSALITCSRLC